MSLFARPLPQITYRTCQAVFVHVAQFTPNTAYYAALYSYSVNYQQLLRQHPSKDNAADLNFHTNAPRGKGLYPAFTPGLDQSASRQAPFVCMVYFSNLTAHTIRPRTVI